MPFFWAVVVEWFFNVFISFLFIFRNVPSCTPFPVSGEAPSIPAGWHRAAVAPAGVRFRTIPAQDAIAAGPAGTPAGWAALPSARDREPLAPRSKVKWLFAAISR